MKIIDNTIEKEVRDYIKTFDNTKVLVDGKILTIKGWHTWSDKGGSDADYTINGKDRFEFFDDDENLDLLDELLFYGEWDD